MGDIFITEEDLKTTAKTIQALNMIHGMSNSAYACNDAIYCLFWWIVWTFSKLYDQEEELYVIEEDIRRFLKIDDNDCMFNDLKNKEDLEERRRKETKNTELINQIKLLINK